MKILKNIFKTLKNKFRKFAVKKSMPPKTALSKLDYADIFISLLPAALFGCLLFGSNAVLILSVCILLPLIAEFLINLILKRPKTPIDFRTPLAGMILALTLSSKLNIFLVISASILTLLLTKTVFKNKPLYIIFPILIVKTVLSLIFFKQFGTYSSPFMNNISAHLPLEYLYGSLSFAYPAKYMFFGLHGGNIGETSVFLLLIGGIYLTFRKLINPVIPISFIAVTGLLSLAFNENIAISLMGGELVFGAVFLTADYGFKNDKLYKNILYGVFCAAISFAIRKILHTDGTIYAVLIANTVFIYFNRRNIKRFYKFIKHPDFKKILPKLKNMFSV